MTSKFEHCHNIRADLPKIRAKCERHSSKNEAVVTEDRELLPQSPTCSCALFREIFQQEKQDTIIDHNRTNRTHINNNPQLIRDLFAGIGHGGGFFGPRRVPLSVPVCKATQKTLTLYQLLLLVKCRSVSMQCSHIRHFTTIESSTSSPCCLTPQSRCTESQRRFYATRTRNHESPIQHRS